MITANFLDDMRVELMFNRLGRYSKRVLDREWGAGAVGNNANAVNAEKRAAPVIFVVRLVLDRQKRVLGQKGAGFPSGRSGQFVLQPFEDCDGNRFARFQNHIADEAV